MSLDEVLKDPETRGYFSSANALADYAEIILHVKKELGVESAPVIVFGASYGGSKLHHIQLILIRNALVFLYIYCTYDTHQCFSTVLAAWFRLKYPHIAYGALASSAPVLLLNKFVPHYEFFDKVSQYFWVYMYYISCCVFPS